MVRLKTPGTLVILIFVTIFGRSIAQDSVAIPANPCPEVFSYVKDGNGNIMGQITLPNNGEGYINVEINVSLATNTNSPQVQLERVNQELTDCQPSIYYLHLPFSNNIPRVTRIWFNGNVICSGPKEPLVPGGRAVWNLWRQSSYETSQRFTCGQNKPKDNVGFFLNIGNVDFNKPSAFPTYQNNDFNTALHNALNNLPTVPTNALDSNPFITGRFPSQAPATPATPRPTIAPPQPTRGSTRGNQCGIAAGKSQVTNLSFGGVDVQEGDFPWMGALMFRNDANAISLACTVTLVSLRYVVTRGNCIVSEDVTLEKEQLLVVLGTRDISNWFVNSAVRNISNIYIKPGFELSKASHDVALIQMDSKVDYLPGKVVPICLWSGRSDLNDNDLDKLIDLNPGTVVGWGDTNTTTKRLNMIKVPVINHLACIKSSSLPAELVGPNTFCGGYTDGQTGTCDTDAGASFCVQKVRGGPWFLRGILSITPSLSETQCNLKGYSLYVDVAEHYQWLHNLISRDGF